MALSVTRSSRSLVRPFEETPSGFLDLSIIDKLLVLRCNARTLHVFRQGPGAARVIKDALSKALVPYYPLAGRLIESSSEHGQLQIECSGEGVWFVEAHSDSTLETLDYFDDVSSIPIDDLLPDQVPQSHHGKEPLVQMQVTQFACGGFVIGLIFCHSICDGLGAAQFLNAVGDIARGLKRPTISPVWCRDFSPTSLPQPPNFTTSPTMLPPILPNYKLEHTNIDISNDQINNLKKQFHDSTGQNCSTFEIVAAEFWRCRTLSVKFSPGTELKLVFFANCRQVLDPPLPQGFYGNCFFPVTITASSESIKESSSIEVVKMIKQAKTKLAVEFGKYLRGEYGPEEDPFAPPLMYTTLFISEWGKLGFNNVDYGFGQPVNIIPIQGSSIIPVGIVASLPLPRNGVRLMTWCLEETHLQGFVDQMFKC